MPEQVDTANVTTRRKLRFATLEDAVAEAQSLADADAAGTLEPMGNWTLGQACSHLAYWAERPFEGYPDTVKPSWLMRTMMRLAKPLIFSRGMAAGITIPGAPGGTLGQDDAPTDKAVARLCVAFAKIDANYPPDPNPLFGPLSHDGWRKLNLRHAELHLGFFGVRQ